MRTLIPSYLDQDYRQSLRYELCDIVYEDYKGRTFFLNQMLAQKKEVLKKIKAFIKNHPELKDYESNSQYWYPFEGVDGNKAAELYPSFYPNKEGEITFFCKKGGSEWDHCDYLFDPVKLQFALMGQDLSQMETDNNNALAVIEINNKIFKILLSVVGDPLNYAGENNTQYIKNYFTQKAEKEKEIKSSTAYTQALKDMVLRAMTRTNKNMVYLQEAYVWCEQKSLQVAIKPMKLTNSHKTPPLKI